LDGRSGSDERDQGIDVLFCRTHLNLADFFTKSLETTHFHKFKDLIMNTSHGLREAWKEEGALGACCALN